MPLDAARDAVIAVQARVIAMLAAQNARLAGQVGRPGGQGGTAGAAGLAEQRQFLDAPVGRMTCPAARRRRPSRSGRKRKPGKQPGAPGSHLAWSREPGRTVPHFPAGACACGADLAGAATWAWRRRIRRWRSR